MRDDSPILFAYDGSEPAKAAIELAGRRLRAGSAAIVATIWQPLETLPYAGVGMMPGDVDAEIEKEANRTAAEGAELARAAGFEATSRSERGFPAWLHVCSLADEIDAGLVVLGSRGRTGIKSVLLGSVASGVTHHTTRPVLVVH